MAVVTHRANHATLLLLCCDLEMQLFTQCFLSPFVPLLLTKEANIELFFFLRSGEAPR